MIKYEILKREVLTYSLLIGLYAFGIYSSCSRKVYKNNLETLSATNNFLWNQENKKHWNK